MTLRLSLYALALTGCGLLKGPPRDGECRSNLRSIVALELNLFELTQRFSVHPAEVAFAPTAGNRYLYLFDDVGEVSRRDGKPSPPAASSVGIGPDTFRHGTTVEWLRERLPVDVAAMLGVQGDCPACTLVVGCVGNLDADDDVDVWTISTAPRRDSRGVDVPQGTALRHRDDR